MGYDKLSKEFKNGIKIEIAVGQAVFKLSIKLGKIFWSRTAWPTLILMIFSSSLNNLL